MDSAAFGLRVTKGLVGEAKKRTAISDDQKKLDDAQLTRIAIHPMFACGGHSIGEYAEATRPDKGHCLRGDGCPNFIMGHGSVCYQKTNITKKDAPNQRYRCRCVSLPFEQDGSLKKDAFRGKVDAHNKDDKYYDARIMLHVASEVNVELGWILNKQIERGRDYSSFQDLLKVDQFAPPPLELSHTRLVNTVTWCVYRRTFLDCLLRNIVRHVRATYPGDRTVADLIREQSVAYEETLHLRSTKSSERSELVLTQKPEFITDEGNVDPGMVDSFAGARHAMGVNELTLKLARTVMYWDRYGSQCIAGRADKKDRAVQHSAIIGGLINAKGIIDSSALYDDGTRVYLSVLLGGVIGFLLTMNEICRKSHPCVEEYAKRQHENKTKRGHRTKISQCVDPLAEVNMHIISAVWYLLAAMIGSGAIVESRQDSEGRVLFERINVQGASALGAPSSQNVVDSRKFLLSVLASTLRRNVTPKLAGTDKYTSRDTAGQFGDENFKITQLAVGSIYTKLDESIRSRMWTQSPIPDDIYHYFHGRNMRVTPRTFADKLALLLDPETGFREMRARGSARLKLDNAAGCVVKLPTERPDETCEACKSRKKMHEVRSSYSSALFPLYGTSYGVYPRSAEEEYAGDQSDNEGERWMDFMRSPTSSPVGTPTALPARLGTPVPEAASMETSTGPSETLETSGPVTPSPADTPTAQEAPMETWGPFLGDPDQTGDEDISWLFPPDDVAGTNEQVHAGTNEQVDLRENLGGFPMHTISVQKPSCLGKYTADEVEASVEDHSVIVCPAFFPRELQGQLAYLSSLEDAIKSFLDQRNRLPSAVISGVQNDRTAVYSARDGNAKAPAGVIYVSMRSMGDLELSEDSEVIYKVALLYRSIVDEAEAKITGRDVLMPILHEDEAVTSAAVYRAISSAHLPKNRYTLCLDDESDDVIKSYIAALGHAGLDAQERRVQQGPDSESNAGDQESLDDHEPDENEADEQQRALSSNEKRRVAQRQKREKTIQSTLTWELNDQAIVDKCKEEFGLWFEWAKRVPGPGDICICNTKHDGNGAALCIKMQAWIKEWKTIEGDLKHEGDWLNIGEMSGKASAYNDRSEKQRRKQFKGATEFIDKYHGVKLEPPRQSTESADQGARARDDRAAQASRAAIAARAARRRAELAQLHSTEQLENAVGALNIIPSNVLSEMTRQVLDLGYDALVPVREQIASFFGGDPNGFERRMSIIPPALKLQIEAVLLVVDHHSRDLSLAEAWILGSMASSSFKATYNYAALFASSVRAAEYMKNPPDQARYTILRNAVSRFVQPENPFAPEVAGPLALMYVNENGQSIRAIPLGILQLAEAEDERRGRIVRVGEVTHITNEIRRREAEEQRRIAEEALRIREEAESAQRVQDLVDLLANTDEIQQINNAESNSALFGMPMKRKKRSVGREGREGREGRNDRASRMRQSMLYTVD
jgi:hypothetical protein